MTTPKAVPVSLNVPTPSMPTTFAKGVWLKRLTIPTVVVAAVVWACWPTLLSFVDVWWNNPQYSHGFLIIPFAAYLLWHRRALFNPRRCDHAWIGLTFLSAGCVLKLMGGFFAFAWPDRISIIFLAAGAFGTLGGWPALRWAWPSICFLVFMIPLYGRVETLLSGPLQRIATAVSANILQTLGLFAQADGTVIILSEHDLGIVEACSGLRMLLAFVAMSTAIVCVIDRSQWQKWVIFASAVPIALLCNIGRIVITALVLEYAGKKWSDLIFHDLAGWLMMPAGLGLLWLELAFFNKLILPEVQFGSPSVPNSSGKSPPPRPSKA